MQQDNLEPRVTALEGDLKDLRNKLLGHMETQGTVDIALLARVDDFIADLRRMERSQIGAFDTLQTSIRTLESRIAAIDERLSNQDQVLSVLVAGQAQMIQLLTGQKPTHD